MPRKCLGALDLTHTLLRNIMHSCVTRTTLRANHTLSCQDDGYTVLVTNSKTLEDRWKGSENLQIGSVCISNLQYSIFLRQIPFISLEQAGRVVNHTATLYKFALMDLDKVEYQPCQSLNTYFNVLAQSINLGHLSTIPFVYSFITTVTLNHEFRILLSEDRTD